MHDYERSSRDYSTGGTLPTWALASAHLREQHRETLAERAIYTSIIALAGLAFALIGCWLRGW